MIVVIGATGLGWAVASRQVATGSSVRLIARSGEASRAAGRLADGSRLELVAADVTDPAALRGPLAEAEAVYVCVTFPLADYEACQASYAAIAKAAPPTARVVARSNVWVFGQPSNLPISPSTPIAPTSEIGELQAAADAALLKARRNAVIIHLPDLYGPGVDNRLIRPLFERGIRGGRVAFPGPVDVPHDFLFVDDAASAMVAAARGKQADSPRGTRYTVGPPHPATVRELVATIAKEAGVDARAAGTPVWLVRLTSKFSADTRRALGVLDTFETHWPMSSSALEQATGFVPGTVLRAGVAQTVRLMRAGTR